MTERWFPVEGYDGMYDISDHGRVRSLDRLNTRGYRIFSKILRPNRANGYPTIVLFDAAGTGTKFYVHRLVARAFCADRIGCNDVNHLDSVRSNNHFSNLEWCTEVENAQHAANAGRIRSGKDHEWSLLTESAVMDIKQCKRAGIRMCDAARMLGVRYKTVANIWYGKQWKHVHG